MIPLHLMNVGNEIIQGLAEDKRKEFTWKLTVDPFIKPSQMRSFISCMYCDDPDNLQRSIIRVDMPFHEDVDRFREEVSAAFAQSFSDLIVRVEGGDIACSVHALMHNPVSNDVACSRCGSTWEFSGVPSASYATTGITL